MYAIPNTVNYDGKELARMKAEGLAPKEELEVLRNRAEDYLKKPTLAVVYRKLTAPTGDKHDYMSMGPYWWPNPDTPDGLPYVRHDGKYNPEVRDANSYGDMSTRAHTLALAAYYFDNAEYAKKACEVLYDWHVNPETKMNPHANFAQSIPGICQGRGIGLIEFAGSSNVFNAVAILRCMDAMDDELYNGMQGWYNDFINWMITSEIGLAEDVYFNNHGSWYDVQVLAAAIFLDRPVLAKRVYTLAYARRHKTQVTAKGEQPHELARTKALCYSVYNLNALTAIAVMAKKLGCTTYVEKDTEWGVNLITAAADFLLPYATDPDSFPYPEMTPAHGAQSLIGALNTIDGLFPEKGYGEIVKANSTPDMLLNIRPSV